MHTVHAAIAVVSLSLPQLALSQESVVTPPASDETPPADLAPEEPGWSARITFGGRHDFGSDLDEGDGSLAISRVGALFELSIPTTETLTVGLRALSVGSFYDFDNAAGLAPGTDDPFGDVLHAEVGAGVTWRANERTFVIVGGNVRSDGESGADFSDTITYGGILAFQHQINPNLALGAGVIMQTELEEDSFLFPIPLVTWRINDKWTLSTQAIPTPVHTEFVTLTYRHSEAWAFGVAGGFERWQFRLDEDGPVPGGVATDSRIPVTLFARWTPNENVEVAGRVGVQFASEIEIDDDRGDEVSQTDLDAGMFLGLTVSIRF